MQPSSGSRESWQIRPLRLLYQQAQLREEETKRLEAHAAWEARQAEEEETAKVQKPENAFFVFFIVDFGLPIYHSISALDTVPLGPCHVSIRGYMEGSLP